MNFSYKHSGDLGDLIFALPLLRWKGCKCLHIDSTGGFNDPLVSWGKGRFTNTKLLTMKPEHLEAVAEFLKSQDYIDMAKVTNFSTNNIKVDINLNEFRHHIKFNNLSFSHLAIVDKDESKYVNIVKEPWITCEPKKIAKVVLARNLRYQGNHAFWEHIEEKDLLDAVFVGSLMEFNIFKTIFPHHKHVKFFPTPTIDDLAGVLQGAEQVICNQGLPHALAEAMKKPLICEVDKTYPAAVFKREGASYV